LILKCPRLTWKFHALEAFIGKTFRGCGRTVALQAIDNAAYESLRRARRMFFGHFCNPYVGRTLKYVDISKLQADKAVELF
jgi:hypothetical protein